MANSLMIIVCILLLLAYVFDLTASKTKVPAVILLLILGFTVGRFTELFGFDIPDLNPLLPVFGTIGLILIVLEGSLELEFNRSKSVLIKKSLLAAAIPMFLMAFLLTYLFQYYGDVSFRDGLLNAIPLCVISSAIAIPSVKGLPSFNKEFVIYESSLSDIIGVLFFNFIALNEVIGLHSFGHFGLQILLITLISFIATIGLAFLLNKIDHHIKFVPIILLVILIYGVSKEYHLPGLIFILFFGLFLGNLDELKQFRRLEKFNVDQLNKEVVKFKDLTMEGAFLVRALFFLLFGFLMKTSEILNMETFFWALGIVAMIFILRAIQLKIIRVPVMPLVFIAPRGLITILLFLTIDPVDTIPLVNTSLITQVIILTAFVMMLGLMTTGRKTPADQAHVKGDELLKQ